MTILVQRLTWLLLSVLFLGIPLPPVRAQVWLGPELQVNTWTTEAQGRPSVAGDAAGEFVVAWDSYRQGMGGCSGYQGSGCFGIFARRLDAEGRPLGTEIQVHDYLGVTQHTPAAAKGANGDFVVAWDTDVWLFGPGDVLARRFDALGQAYDASFDVNANFIGSQSYASVAIDADGDFVIAWFHRDINLTQTGVGARRFDAAGVPQGGDLVVQGQTFDPQSAPEVSMAPAGDFVVVWYGGLPDNIAAQRYAANGVPIGNRFAVNAYAGPQSSAAIGGDGAGGFVAAWTREDLGNFDIAARRFDGGGLPLGGEFRVNPHTTGNQSGTAVAVDPDGNFVVAWNDGASDLAARVYDAQGLPVGGDFRVNVFTPGSQSWPAVAAGRPGQFLVAWQSADQDGDDKGVFARPVKLAFFADGFEAGDSCAWSSTTGGGCP